MVHKIAGEPIIGMATNSIIHVTQISEKTKKIIINLNQEEKDSQNNHKFLKEKKSNLSLYLFWKLHCRIPKKYLMKK